MPCTTIRRISLCILPLVLFTLSACTDGNTDSESPQGPQSGLPVEFIDFYEQFHADTAYQMAHIAFPLQGLRAFSSIDSTVDNSMWTKDEWVFHSGIENLGGTYQVEYNVLSDEMITETISDTSGQNAMQRRFALTSGGWQLIYYVEMQPAARRNR